MAHSQTSAPQLGKFVTSSRAKTIYSACMLIGFLTFVVGLATKNDRIWPSFLVSFFFFVSLAVGGLFFTAIQFATNAGWSVTTRRLSEALASFLPLGAVGAVILALGSHKLFVWLDPNVVAHDHLLQVKHGYLNGPFFLVRLLVFFGLWLLFEKLIIGNSLKQDQSGDESLTLKNGKYSVIFFLVFAISYSFFSVDTMMSLQPHWFSTIFGVYCFAGLFQSTLAFLCILTVWLMSKGLVRGYVNENHLHDLGKFLKAFTIFYAYIGFSQYMLIWYANLPEETEFFWARMHGGWGVVTVAIAVFKFIVPFLALLPRAAKRTPAHLVAVSVLILIMQYVDIYWMVYPNFNDNQLVFSGWELFIFLGLFGLFMMTVTKFFSEHSLVPLKDPRLHESVSHVVTY